MTSPLHSVPEFKQLIDTHAYHAFMVAWHQSQGQPVPLEHTQALRETEQLAQTYLPPELLPQAEVLSRQRMTEIGEHQRRQQAATEVARQLKNYKDSTRNIAGRADGLTQEQAQAIRDGAETLKVPNENAPRFPDKERLDAFFKENFDGLTEGNLQWYARRRGTAEYNEQLKKVNRDPARMEELLDAYAPVADKMAVGRRITQNSVNTLRANTEDPEAANPEFIDVPITESDRRRLAIADALDQHGANAPDNDIDEMPGYTNGIADETRRQAAEYTSRMQHEIASEGGDPEGHMDRRDAIIQAIDKHTSEPATD